MAAVFRRKSRYEKWVFNPKEASNVWDLLPQAVVVNNFDPSLILFPEGLFLFPNCSFKFDKLCFTAA
jgi:hypothetical protein